MWDWDSSRGVLRNTRNEEQICHSQVPGGAAKNQKAWKMIIHEQKAGISGNPEWRTIKGNGWENLQPSKNGFCSAEMDSAYLGKMTARKDNQKFSLKSKKPWKRRGWRLALQGHLGMEGQQVVFRKNKFKRRKLWETEKESAVRNGWHNRGSGTQGAKGGESIVSWTLKWYYKKRRQPTLKRDGVIENHNRIVEKTLSKTQRK